MKLLHVLLLLFKESFCYFIKLSPLHVFWLVFATLSYLFQVSIKEKFNMDNLVYYIQRHRVSPYAP
jgi:hypothetical protein